MAKQEIRDWQIRLAVGWAIVASMGMLAMVAAASFRVQEPTLGDYDTASLERAIHVFGKANNMSERMNAQALIGKKILAAIDAMHHPRASMEAYQGRAILDQIKREASK